MSRKNELCKKTRKYKLQLVNPNDSRREEKPAVVNQGLNPDATVGDTVEGLRAKRHELVNHLDTMYEVNSILSRARDEAYELDISLDYESCFKQLNKFEGEDE